MTNATELLLPVWLLVWVLNVAIASLVVFGLALALSRCRRWPLPVRHAILVAAIIASLLAPVAVPLMGATAIARIQISAAAVPSVVPVVPRPENDSFLPAAQAPSIQRDNQVEEAIVQPPSPRSTALEMPKHVSPDVAPVAPVEEYPKQRPLFVASSARVIGTALAWIWILGVIVCGTQAIVRCAALARWSRTFYVCGSRGVSRAVRVAAERVGMRRFVSVLQSDIVPAPVTFGLLRPKIVIPTGLESELPFEQLCAVIQHEIAHILRRDLWIGALQQLSQIVYWWNPLARAANNRVSDFREQICDDIATRGLAEPHVYATSLVDIAARSAKGTHVPATIGFGASPVRQLEERIGRILGSQGRNSLRLGRHSLLGVLAVSALMTATMLLAQVRLQAPAEKQPGEQQAGSAKPDSKKSDSAAASTNSGRPSLHELCVKMAEYERAYLPYYIKAMETYRMGAGLTPQERKRYPWADGRKHQRLMEYAQREDRFWFRKETMMVDGVDGDRFEQYSDGKRLVKVLLREGKPTQVDIEHIGQFETQIPRWLMANPLRGIFPLAVWSNSDLFSRVFAAKESQIQLDWDGDDAKLTFEFGPPAHESRFVLWLSRAHDWHPVKLQRFMGKNATVFHDEWVVTRFAGGSHWRVADGTIRMRNFHDMESPNAKIVYSIDFHVSLSEWGYQAGWPAGFPKPVFGPEHSNRMFEYQIPAGVDVRDDQRPERKASHVEPTHGGSTGFTIHVVDVDGKPIAGAVAQLLSYGFDAHEVERVQTDNAGVALLQKMPVFFPSSGAVLRTTAAGYRPATWGTVPIIFGKQVVLAPQTHGVAVDEKGVPLPKVWLPVDVIVFGENGVPRPRNPGSANSDWSDKEGRFALKAELTLHEPNKPVRLIGADERLEKMAIAFIAPKDLGKPQALTLRPVCQIRGGFLLEGITATDLVTIVVEAENGIPVAEMYTRGQPQPQGLSIQWNFRLPPGTYHVTSRQSYYRSGFHFWLPITIAPGQKEIDMGIKLIPATGVLALRGKPAPELEVQWRPGQETTFEKLRGRVVVLDFWGTWCSPCIEELPELMDIAQQFHDRPVEWIAIHTPKRDGFESLDWDLVDLKRRVWKNRELSFKTVIDQSTLDDNHAGRTQTRYGIAEWPTLVVIDQQGKIVGPVKPSNLAATISRLLDRESAK